MARDKNEKVWIGGGAVVALLVAGAAWSFVVSPKLSHVDSLRSQTSDAQTQNLSLNANVSKLKDEYARIATVRKQLAEAQAQLPSDSGMSALTTQLSAQARANHVSITQFTATDPAPVGVASTAPAPTDSSSAAPVAGAATSAAPSGNYSIAVTLSVNGSQSNDLAFARAVQQQGPRIALASSVQLATGSAATGSGGGSGGTTMTLQLDVFVAPVAPAAPAATPTATPSTAP
ncbi:MAG TPA: hypothetical protein VGH43_08425 [Jatrophihabitans sp.]|jgi:hypothetical protein